MLAELRGFGSNDDIGLTESRHAAQTSDPRSSVRRRRRIASEVTLSGRQRETVDTMLHHLGHPAEGRTQSRAHQRQRLRMIDERLESHSATAPQPSTSTSCSAAAIPAMSDPASDENRGMTEAHGKSVAVVLLDMVHFRRHRAIHRH